MEGDGGTGPLRLPRIDGVLPPAVGLEKARRKAAELRLRAFIENERHSEKAPVRVLEGVSGRAYLSRRAIEKMLHGRFTEDRAAILANLPGLYEVAVVVREDAPEGRERDALVHRIQRLGAVLALPDGRWLTAKLTVREYKFEDVTQPVRRALYDAQVLPEHGWGRTPLDKS